MTGPDGGDGMAHHWEIRPAPTGERRQHGRPYLAWSPLPMVLIAVAQWALG
ncbi:hypothetical protein ACH492_08625 [Streptomyces sp. NPDC019443]|uniref:hypothetical protein n=1 Tax=Streptomyces sp. NPDC019443 TaxID=3365061 RepID=UPI00378EEDB6